MALRNKAFGTAQEFVWAFDSSEYATLENSSTIKVFKNFKERKSFKPEYGAEGTSSESLSKVLSYLIQYVTFVGMRRNLRRIHAGRQVHQRHGVLLLRLGTSGAHPAVRYLSRKLLELLAIGHWIRHKNNTFWILSIMVCYIYMPNSYLHFLSKWIWRKEKSEISLTSCEVQNFNYDWNFDSCDS